MSTNLLKEMFLAERGPFKPATGSRGMQNEDVTVRVPDEDMPGLQRAVLSAVKSGELPKTALKWARSAESAARASGKGDREDDAPTPKKKAKEPAKGSRRHKAEPEGDDEETGPEPIRVPKNWMPDDSGLPMPKPASFAAGSEEDYESPLSHLFPGSKEPETMPRAGGGEMPIPKGGRPRYSGPSPVGRPWEPGELKRGSKADLSGPEWARAMREPDDDGDGEDPDLDPSRFRFTDAPEPRKLSGPGNVAMPRKPGMLGRLFGKKRGDR